MNSLLSNTRFEAWTGRLVRTLRRKHNERCFTILTYHSIAREPSVFSTGPGLRHSPAAFEREVEYLAENFNVIALSELVSMIRNGEQPRRAVAITLDDGYADALTCAAQICYRRRLPLTIFPVTSVVGNTGLIWQHKLAWLVSQDQSDRVWDALSAEGWATPEDRHDVEGFVRRHFRVDIPDILEEVMKQVGVTSRSLAEKLRPYVEPDEIARADSTFVEFGNHTDTHPVLSAITDHQQLVEIGAASRKLMEWTNRAPTTLAYPFGLKPHYNDRSRSIAEATGHLATVDMRRRMNLGIVDPYELSRKPAVCPSQTDFEKLVEDWPANTLGAPPVVKP
ncbi:MAG TPA: polysaccharide deacetylase family protein [Phycisphaerae bacterium]|nr:polysaccharide deacetylase family protein [Phycisphaerae bacterium]HRW53930.1 polysaccharide deacetylase family protein [Phycisphaerae bacterium]